VDTPEFLLWALEYSCPIRGFQDGSDPERTERHLRAARAASDALREERIFEGLCVDPPGGFRIDEALEFCGGLAATEQACGNCPANALQNLRAGSLAGCYGIVPLPLDPAPVHAAIERGIDAAYLAADSSKLLPATAPRWYGLWLQSPIAAERLLALFRVLRLAVIVDPDCRAAMEELLVGMNVALNADCRLHARLYAAGRVEGPWWRLVPHCPRCNAAWPNERSRHCGVCGYVGGPAPDKKRRARGRRPYFPLERLLGGQQAAAAFLSRYEDFRKSRALPDREPSPPLPAPPDNPRAD
jgi:hypothetical protein